MEWQGKIIKEKAKVKGLSLTKIAKNIGVSRQAINDWINGQIPKGMYLISLCKLLDITPDYFFGIQDEKPILLKPVHRTRRSAKINTNMQEKALKLVEEYTILFKNCGTSHLIPVERSCDRSLNSVKIIAKKLRELSGISEDNPIDYNHVFYLLGQLGIYLIFRTFPSEVKSYALYTKIYNHRVVFVNSTTNILDLIFPILHEAVHAIRDEIDPTAEYNQEEEDFCDLVASYVQFTQGYIKKTGEVIKEQKSRGQQINSLKTFGMMNKHAIFGIVKRIKEIDSSFDLDVGGADSNLKKRYPSIGDILNDVSTARDYINRYKSLSPNFINLLTLNIENISLRKLGEYVEIENFSDISEIQEELTRYVGELIE